MSWKLVGIILVVIAAWGMIGCGGEKAPEQKKTDASTPGTAEPGPSGWGNPVLTSEPRHFGPDSLWQYINGEAELYLGYGFVELTASEYKDGEVEMIVDQYRFDTPEHAYGLYSMMRPDDPQIAPLGVQGFFTGVTVEFVKGDQVFSLTAFEESRATAHALQVLSYQLDSLSEGAIEPPGHFKLFPTDSTVPHSDKLIAKDYLGQPGIDDVYTTEYTFDGEPVTLFLADDVAGAKYLNWSQVQAHVEAPAGLPFDGPYFAFNNEYYGTVLVGLRSGYLAGMVSYQEEYLPFMTAWLESLKGVGK